MEKKVVAIYPEYSQTNCEQKFVFLLQSNNIYINKLVADCCICVLLVSNVVTYKPNPCFTVFKIIIIIIIIIKMAFYSKVRAFFTYLGRGGHF